VATRGLNAFSRMSDGRLPRGPLYDLLKQRLEIAGDLDAVSLVIDTWKGSRGSIAALATTVCQAAQKGDTAASQIVADAVAELVTLVETTRTLVGFTDGETVPVSYSGGMFSDTGLLDGFTSAMHALPAAYDLRQPLLDPAVGAALYAAKHSGHPLSAASVKQLADAATTSEKVS